MHELQQLFATAEGEAQWEADLRALFSAGELDAIRARLEPALAALDNEFGSMCLSVVSEPVTIAGWDELVEAIESHEGEPIAAMTLAIANETDRVFEKGQLHHPYMLLGLYSDEHYAFSDASAEELIAQTQAEDGPAWAGWDEDIEVYLDIEGLDRINTALLHHKQRHFFRDDAPEKAPLRYVEYVLGCWWRALLFQQAVASECAAQALPGGIPIISGMVDMRPEILMIHGSGAPVTERERETGTKPIAPLIAADFIHVRAIEEVKELTGSDLRRRVTETGQEDEAPKKGFIARIFGR